MSHQKIYTLWYCVVNDELPSTSTEIFEQIGVMQKVVVPGISELKDLVPDKKWGDQTQFSSKKDSRKEQCIWHCLLYLILYQLMDCVIQ